MPSTTTGDREKANALKLEGNSLFRTGQYEEAYQKYSDALCHDDNAILYANRAACSLALREYLDAACDAKKATDLDPKYHKAWGRLATATKAINNWDMAVTAWTQALETLEDDGTPTHKRLKAEYEAGLKDAESGRDAPPKQDVYIHVPHTAENKSFPWLRALAMESELARRQDVQSSAWVILHAYREFSEGVKIMKMTKTRKVNGKVQIEGKPALTGITNGILRDPRVFHMDSEWIEQYNRQVEMEVQFFKGWLDSGPKAVQEEALQRLKRSGWDDVRPAMAATVRAWIMMGFMQSGFGSKATGLNFYRSAVDMLEWGRRTWPNVPSSDRGVIFERTFVRGVRCLLLGAMHSHTVADRAASPYTIEDIREAAQQLLDETLEHPLALDPAHPVDRGFYASFWLYPTALAHTMLGWAHLRSGRDIGNSADDEAQGCFAAAALEYSSAAETYHADDEYRAVYLATALEALWFARAPLHLTLPLCRHIRRAYGAMKRLWGGTAGSEARDVNIKRALAFEKMARRQMLAGQVGMDDVLRPPEIAEVDARDGTPSGNAEGHWENVP